MPEQLAFQGLLIVCVTTMFVASLRFIGRLVELKQQPRPGHAPNDELHERLYRIETTVEATALEVERLSEANRFMAKLLADHTRQVAAPNRPERVITPH